MINQKKQGLDWSDTFLGIGGLLAGATIPYLFELADKPQGDPKIGLLIAGFIGMLLLGIGCTLKARN